MTLKTRGRKFAINVSIDGDCLTIKVSGSAAIRTLDAIMDRLVVEKKRVTDLVLDLSDLHFISSAGALGMICLCSGLIANKIEGIAGPFNFYLRRPPANVLTYLATLGFFTEMSNKARLSGSEDLVRFESERKERAIEKQKRDIFNGHLQNARKPIVMPMATIPQNDPVLERDFENSAQNFIGSIRRTFEKLFLSSHFNFNEGDVSEFYAANGELWMNIFEHSESWGLGVIHADPAHGTTVSYHDIGVGIKGSLNRSPKAGKEFEKFETDYDAMKWALKEGNSSKLGGNGRGLNIVEELLIERVGTIEVRSGDSLLQKKPGDKLGQDEWRASKVPWFPGTQINFFVPCVSS
jgi:hypothetical protein